MLRPVTLDLQLADGLSAESIESYLIIILTHSNGIRGVLNVLRNRNRKNVTAESSCKFTIIYWRFEIPRVL